MRVVNSWGGWGHAMPVHMQMWPEARTHEIVPAPPEVAQPSVEPTKTKRRVQF